MIIHLKELLQFCFSNIFVYTGLTIWLLILTGYMRGKVIPKIKFNWQKVKDTYKNNFQKELKTTGINK